MERNLSQTQKASIFLILSKLHLFDLESYIDQGDDENSDIRVIRKNGESISLQVISGMGDNSFKLESAESKCNNFKVFVIHKGKTMDPDSEPDIFIVPDTALNYIIEQNKKEIDPRDFEGFKNQWNYIKFGYGEDGDLNETSEQEVISLYNTVLELQKINYSRERICNHISISDEELTDLEIEFNRITGK